MAERSRVRPLVKSAAMLVGAAASAAVVVLVACADVGTTTYGDPSGLRSANLPGDGGTEAVVCGDGGFGEASASQGCPVSFSKDIYPLMTANGAWKCAAGGPCHGGQQAPTIDASTPAAVIASLRDYHVAGSSNPYINADASDPAQSSFECNMTGQCGSGMPDLRTPPGARAPTSAEVCKIDAWLRCGSPNN